jgi:hypothetical protein
MSHYKPQKKKKDPNAPKQPLSAYFIFSTEERLKVKEGNPNYSICDVAKELGKRWAEMDPALKQRSAHHHVLLTTFDPRTAVELCSWALTGLERYAKDLAVVLSCSTNFLPISDHIFLDLIRSRNLIGSVADPGCLSRIPDPDFYPSRISDPGSKNSNKERGEKKCCHNFLCSQKFHKIENYFSFEVLKKKMANFLRIMELLTQKIVTKLSKIWVWDPRSGIRKKPIPNPGVKKAPDPGSGSATLLIGEKFFNIFM